MRWVAREQVAETIPHGLLHETCMPAFGAGESEDVEGGADVFAPLMERTRICLLQDVVYG
jgi:hypothetical protein